MVDLLTADLSTLDGARYILTVKNERKLATSGPMEAGTEVCCLRANNYGYYVPCVAHIVGVTDSGHVRVDLWQDRSERVTVSKKAILWWSREAA